LAHIQGEAGTPPGGVGSAVVGRNSPVLCAGGVLFQIVSIFCFFLIKKNRGLTHKTILISTEHFYLILHEYLILRQSEHTGVILSY
jgi:hypothetical protein